MVVVDVAIVGIVAGVGCGGDTDAAGRLADVVVVVVVFVFVYVLFVDSVVYGDANVVEVLLA
jgi:hypothetical protein